MGAFIISEKITHEDKKERIKEIDDFNYSCRAVLIKIARVG